MKKLFVIGTFAVVLFLGMIFSVSASNLSGEDVMRKADERYTGNSSRQLTTMELIDSRGKTRERSVVSYYKDFGDVEKTVMVFQKPADVEGVGYLSYAWNKADKDDDTWLFLPALGKSRRISGSSRNDNFMGTDFTYDDMGDRRVEEDTHVLKGEEALNGAPCWVVESTPKEKRYIYSRKVVWVNQDTLLASKVEYYDRQNQLMKVFTTSDISKIDGIWTIGTMEMHNVQTNHRTVIHFDSVEYNIDVEDSFFTVASLERGRIR